MTTITFLDDFFSYYNRDWSKRSENVGRSFTYGACFYDGVKERHLELDSLDTSYCIDDAIYDESGARDEWIRDLDDSIKVDLVDISLLDELVCSQIEEAQEEQQEELFDELDDEEYRTREELEDRVADLLGDYEYIDKTLGNVCDDYEEDRGIDYKGKLFDSLDAYSFVAKDEVIGAIQDYFYKNKEGEPSYGELSEYGEWANEYIDDRGLEFEEEEE